MGVRIAAIPETLDLLYLPSVKSELGIAVSTYDTILNAMISRASGIVYELVGRPLYRAQFTETLRGTDTTRLALSRRPIASLDAISHLDVAEDTDDYSVEDYDAGFLYYSVGFSKGSSPLSWSITYTAGFFLEGDNLTSSISAAAADDSYNSATAEFHRHLKTGDYLNASSFGETANNGLHLVVTATTSKITVAEALVDENAGSRTLTLENVPGPFKAAALQLVKDMYFNRTRDSSIAAERAGPIATEYSPSHQATREAERILAPVLAP